jgi:uncharacterized protein involved in oxidation of intracellular sulfur
MARTLFVLTDAPYGTERSCNAELMLQGPTTRHAVEVGVCASCMDARGIADAELTEGTKRGTLSQPTDWTAWADKTLVF